MLKYIGSFMRMTALAVVVPHLVVADDVAVADMTKLFQILENLKYENQRLEKLGSYQETLEVAAQADAFILRDRAFPTELCEGIEYACAVLPITTQNFRKATK